MIIILVFGDVAVLDTAVGVWCDRKGIVNSPRIGRYSNDAAGGEASNELTRRCRHAAAAVGDHIFMYGGLRGGMCYTVHSIFLNLKSKKQVCFMKYGGIVSTVDDILQI